MKRSFNREILRSIRGSLGRFIAIAAIVALGTGFYSGLRMTAPDMDLSADHYYDGTDLMDIRVVSTMGLTDDDIDALRSVDGVDHVMASYETDVMTLIGDESYAVRMHSLPSSAENSVLINAATVQSDDDDYLNRLVLSEGRWPTQAGECIISADRVMNTPTSLGDTVTVTECNSDIDSTLSTTTYTIVGFAHSSYYVSSSSMGTTTLGSGTIQQFMYVLDSNFAEEYPYTEAFITVTGAADLLFGSDAYEQRVTEVMDNIDAIADDRENARWTQIRSDAQDELNDARSDYDSQRNDAYKELDDALDELNRNAETISDSEQEIESGQNSYDEGVAELENQRAQALDEIAAAAAQLDQAQTALDAARDELESSRELLAQAWEQAGIAPSDATATLSTIDEGIAELNSGISLLNQQLAGLDSNDASQAVAASALESQISELESNVSQLVDQRDSLQELIAQQQAFDEAEPSALQQIEQGQSEIDEGRVELERQQSLVEQQLDDAEDQLARAAEELASGRDELDEGRSEYEQGLTDYEDARSEVERNLSDAEVELNDAQAKIDEIEFPNWLIMDRNKNYGVVSFYSDANRVDSIAAIFPFIFFLVAALVALTTMTRMVEEERVLIGTFKALGYSRSRITSKYLIYAAAASVLGSVVGIIALSFALPATIMQAYTIIYSVPQTGLSLDVPIALLAAFLGIGITLVATWAAALSTLREQPAQLMLPRAPKAGKRILLERAGFLWRRLSFSWKVTFRNLFRYKRRLVMTLIGIAGCTALLLTGLGLQDAINDIIDKHFGELVHYNVVVTVDDDIDDSSNNELNEVLSRKDMVSEYACALSVSMIAEDSESTDPVVTLIVPENVEEFQQLWLMRERIGHAEIDLSQVGVIVTEKLATTVDIGVGDTLILATQDDMGNATDETYGLKVGGIMENYLYNYVFVTPSVYEEVFGTVPNYTSTYAAMPTDEEVRAAFSEDVRRINGIKTISYNDETIDTYRTMLSSVDMVVIVLIVSAALLAFIVLYNLTNINITERQREIATLKVLGFNQHEVDFYIYREAILLSILGCLIGLVLGIFIESFVVVTAEVDQVMFGRDIHALSFILAFVLTMVFTVVVMIFMRSKLARIDMIESLKSNE